MSPSSTSSSSYSTSSSMSSYKEEKFGQKGRVLYKSSSGEKQKTKSCSTTRRVRTPTTGAHHSNCIGEAHNNYDRDDDDGDGEVKVEVGKVGSTCTCAGSFCLTVNHDTDSDDAFVVAKEETEESKHRIIRTDCKFSRSRVPTMATESSISSTTEFFRDLLEQPSRISSSTTTTKTRRKRQDHHSQHQHGGRRGRRPVRHNKRRRRQLLELARYLQAKTVPINLSIPPMNEPDLAIPTWRMFYEHSEYLDKTLEPLLDLLSYDDDSISSLKTSFCTCNTHPTSSSSPSPSSYSCRHNSEFSPSEETTVLDSTTTVRTKQNKFRSVDRFRVMQNTNLEASNEVCTICSATMNLTNYFQDRIDDENDGDREWMEEYCNLRHSERELRRELLRVDRNMARTKQYIGSHNFFKVESPYDDHHLSDTSDSSTFTIADMSMLNTPYSDSRVLRDKRSPPFCSYNDPNNTSRTHCSNTVLPSSRKVFRAKNRVWRRVVNLIGTTILSLTGIKLLGLLQNQSQLQHLHQSVIDRNIGLPHDVTIDFAFLPELIPSTNKTSTWSLGNRRWQRER